VYDNIILNNHTFMSTLSVPLDAELMKFVENISKESGLTRASVMRQALKKYAEEHAVQKVLSAMDEPTLKGDLDTLLAKI
jgi:predicted transcriptional regulator